MYLWIFYFFFLLESSIFKCLKLYFYHFNFSFIYFHFLLLYFQFHILKIIENFLFKLYLFSLYFFINFFWGVRFKFHFAILWYDIKYLILIFMKFILNYYILMTTSAFEHRCFKFINFGIKYNLFNIVAVICVISKNQFSKINFMKFIF